jgi:hypothetical protein
MCVVVVGEGEGMHNVQSMIMVGWTFLRVLVDELDGQRAMPISSNMTKPNIHQP